MTNDEAIRAVFDALTGMGEVETVVTSVRLPAGLRDAAKTLQAMGVGPSFNEVLVQGARDRILVLARRAGLVGRYAEHAEIRPSVLAVAAGMAGLDGSPLADREDLLADAVAELEVVRGHVEFDADDVLLYAAALLAHR